MTSSRPRLTVWLGVVPTVTLARAAGGWAAIGLIAGAFVHLLLAGAIVAGAAAFIRGK